MSMPVPPTGSVAHRAQISAIISSLRPTRLRTSVFSLPAHRIPTLWTLYRRLLRDSPSEDIRWRIRLTFRRDKSLRKATEVRVALARYHRWANIFASAKEGNTRLQEILQRYTQMIVAKRKKERMSEAILEEIAWWKKLQNRPILTGSYLRPSWFNGPLPQMKPLPLHVRALIHARRARRERRIMEMVELNKSREDLAIERDFEAALAQTAKKDDIKLETVFAESHGEWERPLVTRTNEIVETLKRDDARAALPYPPDMLETIKAARREKIANKTRELERERRGAVLRRTILRRRQGPPAHVLATMSEKQKHMDKVSRSVSEIGYVAEVKRALGFKFRNPDAWKAEIGQPEDMERLDKMLEEICAENDRRMAKSESSQ